MLFYFDVLYSYLHFTCLYLHIYVLIKYSNSVAYNPTITAWMQTCGTWFISHQSLKGYLSFILPNFLQMLLDPSEINIYIFAFLLYSICFYNNQQVSWDSFCIGHLCYANSYFLMFFRLCCVTGSHLMCFHLFKYCSWRYQE